jgi:hypothetical protein
MRCVGTARKLYLEYLLSPYKRFDVRAAAWVLAPHEKRVVGRLMLQSQ